MPRIYRNRQPKSAPLSVVVRIYADDRNFVERFGLALGITEFSKAFRAFVESGMSNAVAEESARLGAANDPEPTKKKEA